jgi:membrane protein DedA with SNARE-associated domain
MAEKGGKKPIVIVIICLILISILVAWWDDNDSTPNTKDNNNGDAELPDIQDTPKKEVVSGSVISISKILLWYMVIGVIAIVILITVYWIKKRNKNSKS